LKRYTDELEQLGDAIKNRVTQFSKIL
jgi:hypothetical protein